jgi:hypothetical protein
MLASRIDNAGARYLVCTNGDNDSIVTNSFIAFPFGPSSSTLRYYQFRLCAVEALAPPP